MINVKIRDGLIMITEKSNVTLLEQKSKTRLSEAEGYVDKVEWAIENGYSQFKGDDLGKLMSQVRK